jgi:hypothetical protein
MFARRLVRSPSSLSSSIRAFSASPSVFRSPALADITPEGVTSFDAKQKEFRERLVEQSRKKETSQSTVPISSSSANPPTPTAPSVSTASMSSDTASRGLGSLSKNAEPEPEEDGAKKGKLSSLIYGTKEGREMDREIEHSFSQVLARGKYVHSIVFHEVKPDKVDEYVDLVGNWYPRMAGMPENKVHLVGSWRTEVGDCDTFGKPIPPFY